MIDLLKYANRTKIANELKVHPSTVGRWAKGESVPSWAVQQVERLIVGERKEAPLAEQLEGLEARLLAAIEQNRDLLAAALASEIVSALPAGLFQPPGDEASDESANPTDTRPGPLRGRQ